ncbi:hypothetical protein BWQ96_00150 [Gracilariopsis chorda]|uniref:BHLH domain-containing protein n=1 Tax=Gracilariopsis chorda TaxID=448386 RepID=A0A2V3JCI2_9FLOR|nr:hypothetical protein BWQ96_00150 [Gracilariopsis chorda]|eukprot:PXF49990.1 hypothetical protein BWQ96_00150 [Gracilariopsis chorda]
MADTFDIPDWLLDSERPDPLRPSLTFMNLLDLGMDSAVAHLNNVNSNANNSANNSANNNTATPPPPISSLTDVTTTTDVKNASPQRLPRRTSTFPSPHQTLVKARRQQPPDSRQRHNEMMRKNRHKFNAKFEQLAQLLRSFELPNTPYKPMKNKIQTLERAIFQYATMQRNNARFRSTLSFAPDATPALICEYARILSAAPSLPVACQHMLAHMCAAHDWKYAELWLRDSTQPNCYSFSLAHTLIPLNNMPETRSALSRFATDSNNVPLDPFLLSQAAFSSPVWIPDMSKQRSNSCRARMAATAGITTAIIIPVAGSDAAVGQFPHAILTLMHANDELLSFANLMRPYDSATMIDLLHLVSALAKSHCSASCPSS